MWSSQVMSVALLGNRSRSENSAPRPEEVKLRGRSSRVPTTLLPEGAYKPQLGVWLGVERAGGTGRSRAIKDACVPCVHNRLLQTRALCCVRDCALRTRGSSLGAHLLCKQLRLRAAFILLLQAQHWPVLVRGQTVLSARTVSRL